MSKLRLGSRGSALALAQAAIVRDRLRALHPSLEIETVRVVTTGDKLSEAPLPQIGGKGIFIKEIEEALLEKRVDLAVHSLKDLPTLLPPGLVLAAVLEREDPRDCVVSRFGEQLMELPRGAVVGTSSLRRQAQVRAAKQKIRVQDIRGNLDTRLRKVREGEVDSIVVAYAGVRRLRQEDEVSEILSYDLMLPAPGQGCLGIEIRENDAETRKFVSSLDHLPSFRAASAERAFLAALGGGCRVPIAAYAREEKGRLILDGLVISPDGKERVRGTLAGSLEEGPETGAELARKLTAEGAAGILKNLEKPADGMGA